MQIIDGHLTVEAIKGKRGDFHVGRLATSIGEFKVEDAALEQFEVGVYQGRFVLEKIFIKNVPWRGGLFTNLMVKIAQDGFIISDETADTGVGTHVPTPVQAEPDPADDRPALDSSPAAEPTPPGSLPAEDASSSSSDDEKLFGIEIHQRFSARQSPIQLDNTIDRIQFRAQRTRLKEVGYRFDAASQSWSLPQ
jgi:hypothetical protein